MLQISDVHVRPCYVHMAHVHVAIADQNRNVNHRSSDGPELCDTCICLVVKITWCTCIDQASTSTHSFLRTNLPCHSDLLHGLVSAGLAVCELRLLVRRQLWGCLLDSIPHLQAHGVLRPEAVLLLGTGQPTAVTE